MATKIYSIPEKSIGKFKRYYNTMLLNCPISSKKSGMRFNESMKIVIVDAGDKMSKSHLNFFNEVVSKTKCVKINNNIIDEQIRLLESITKKKIRLVENNEGVKNLAVEALNTVSDNLNMLKQNIQQALDQVDVLNGQDLALTKLRGLESIVDSAITDISEVIMNVTGTQTDENLIDEPINEDDEKGFVTTTDNAVQNIDKVSKLIDKGDNVILDDDQNQ